jgi:prevent-host-death family protein
MQLNMHEAKSRLSDLVAAAERGEDVVIARNGTRAARLVADVHQPDVGWVSVAFVMISAGSAAGSSKPNRHGTASARRSL